MATRTRVERCQWCNKQLVVPLHVQTITCPVCRRTNHLALATNNGNYQQPSAPWPSAMYNNGYNQRPSHLPSYSHQQSMRPPIDINNSNTAAGVYNNGFNQRPSHRPTYNHQQSMRPSMNYNNGNHTEHASTPPMNKNNGNYIHQVSTPPSNNNNGSYNQQVSTPPRNNNNSYHQQESTPPTNNNSGNYNHQVSIPPKNNNNGSYNNQVSTPPRNNNNNYHQQESTPPIKKNNGNYNHQVSIPPTNNNNGSYNNQVSTPPKKNNNGSYNHQVSTPPKKNNNGSYNHQVSTPPMNNNYGNYNQQVSTPPMNNNNDSYNQQVSTPTMNNSGYYHQQAPAPPINNNSGNNNQVLTPPKLEKKRAVLCGVSYMNTEHSLDGSVTDVESIKRLLIDRMGFSNSSILVLTEVEPNPMRIPTAKNMMTALRWLVQGCQAGDSLVFYYTGHGSRVADDDDDEYDGYDESLCPVDYKTAGKIIDDKINEIIVRPLPRGAQLHTIIDTCYSGTALDLCFISRSNSRRKYYWEDHENPNGAYQGTNGGLAVCISACEDHQKSGNTTAFTGTATGALTYSLVKALQSEPTSTYGHIMNNMRTEISKVQSGFGINGSNTSASTQEPQLSSSEKFDIYSKKLVL